MTIKINYGHKSSFWANYFWVFIFGHFFCPFLKLRKTFPAIFLLKNIINQKSYLKKLSLQNSLNRIFDLLYFTINKHIKFCKKIFYMYIINVFFRKYSKNI
jgi:hypothetical protein